MKIGDIISAIEEQAPLWLQESWDNAGLQVGDPVCEATGALLCVDVTEAIVDEAVARGVNLIVSHHPLLFKGLKRITCASATERIVIKAIKHGITIYSAHTNIDSAARVGVSWATGHLAGLVNMRVLVPQEGGLMKLAVFVPVDYRDKVCEALWAAGAGQMGNYDRCAYMVDGTGTYRPLDGASPAIGTVGRSHNEPEIRVEVVFPAALCGGVVRAMLAAHPYEEPAFDLLKLENKVDAGLGVIGELEVPLPGKDYLESVKQSLGIGALPYAGDASRLVRKVALCGGAGAEFIPAAIAAGADVYMCGDLKYHDFTTYGDSILLANIGHYESEQCTKGIFYEIIRKKFPNFAAYYAEQEKNPISFL